MGITILLLDELVMIVSNLFFYHFNSALLILCSYMKRVFMFLFWFCLWVFL